MKKLKNERRLKRRKGNAESRNERRKKNGSEKIASGDIVRLIPRMTLWTMTGNDAEETVGVAAGVWKGDERIPDRGHGIAPTGIADEVTRENEAGGMRTMGAVTGRRRGGETARLRGIGSVGGDGILEIGTRWLGGVSFNV